MMQFIRDRAQGWFATLLIGFLCIPFALWGVQSYLDASGAIDVARVDGDAIGQSEFRQAFERARAALEARLGEDAAAIDSAVQKREVLEGLVRARLIRHYAAERGLRVSDAMVAAEITRLPAFQADGVFSPQLYEERLRYSGLSRRGFEEQLREELVASQFRQGVIQGVFVTPSEHRAVAGLRAERRDIAFVQLSTEALAREVTVSDEALRAWFEAHRDRYVGEPSATVEYLSLAAADFALAVEPEAGVLEQLYEENRNRFEQPEERRARHILVRLPADADESAVGKARAEAEALRARILAGEDFARVAEAESDDPGSARKGGDLGFFRRGLMDAAFEAAAFSLPEAEVSEPVRSAFGYHLIRVDAIRPHTQKSFQEVRDELLAEWRREQGERRYFEELERLETLAFERGDDLQGVADALGLEVQRNDDFRVTTAKGVLTSDAVIRRVFDPEFAASGLLSEPIEVGTNRVVVIRVLESRPAAALDFEAARAQVTRDYTAEQARQQVEARGQELLAAVTAGAPLAGQLRDGETLRELAGATRNHPELPRAAARLAFRVPAGRVATAGPQAVSTRTPTGDFILAVVSAVQVPGEVTPEMLAAVDESAWADRRAGAEWTHVEAELRRRAAIVINDTAL
jgi:peptidyl-prolyl cis-trans isomerase D